MGLSYMNIVQSVLQGKMQMRCLSFFGETFLLNVRVQFSIWFGCYLCRNSGQYDFNQLGLCYIKKQYVMSPPVKCQVYMTKAKHHIWFQSVKCVQPGQLYFQTRAMVCWDFLFFFFLFSPSI